MEATADSPSDGEGPTSRAEELTEAWLAALYRGDGGPERPLPLLEAYRSLGLVVINSAVAYTADGPTDGGRSRGVDRALAEVVAAIRRLGLSIADLIEDLGRFRSVIVRELVGGSAGTSEGTAILPVTLRALRGLDDVGAKIVRVLERSALRAQRERSETLAAMTDQLSHELRNRLGAARTASDMLVDPSIVLAEDGLERVAQLVRSSVEAALRTVGDVRTLVVSRARVDDPAHTVALPRLLRGVVDELEPTAHETGVLVEMDSDPVECEVDAARMRLIVFNLVGNGIKYRDSAKDRPYVRIRSARRGGEVVLRIEDNGVGIPSDEIEDVFLYRTRGTDTEDVPGSGLGLAIVSEAVDQMGGEISVTSDVGVGATFRVVFRPVEPLT